MNRLLSCLPDGFSISSEGIQNPPPQPKQPIAVRGIGKHESVSLHRIMHLNIHHLILNVIDVAHLKELIHSGYRVRDLDVRGSTSRSVDEPFRVHPVVV